MAKLYINGEQCDLGNTVIAITRQAYMFENLNDRNVEFSNIFEIPNSQANKRIFGNPARVYSTSTGFDSDYTAVYVEDTHIFNGRAVLLEANKVYKLQLIDGSTTFWQSLSAKISDYIDTDIDDFVFNKAAYDAYKVLYNTDSAIWCWPVVSMHQKNVPNLSPLDATKPEQYSRPMVDLNTLAGRAFYGAGWAFGGTVQSFPYCITTNHNDFFFTSYQKTMTISEAGAGTYSPLLTTPDFEINVGHPPGTPEYITVEVGCSFRMVGELTSTAPVTITFFGFYSGVKESHSFGAGTNQINIITNVIESDTDPELFYITIEHTEAFAFSGVLYNLYSETRKALNTNPWNGYLVKAFDNMPDISLIDLARAVFQLNCLYFTSNSAASLLTFIKPNEISTLAALDWSAKFITGSDVVRADFGSYAKTNYLRYTNDATVADFVGRYSFPVVGANREATADAITLPFGASKDILLDVYNCSAMLIYNNTERLDSINCRILEYYDTGDGFTAAKFAPLAWEYVAQAHYSNVFAALANPRVIECKCTLRSGDVAGFDFARPVYIAALQSNFLVLKIGEYTKGEPTDVTLLKL